MKEVEDRKSRKIKEGVVVSNSMQKTVVIKVSTTLQHPKYGKVIKRASKYYAHDEKDELQIGDTVMIAETRPLSKMKRWRVVEKIQTAERSGESK